MSEIIDFHAHYFPVEYLNGLKKAGSSSTDVARDLNAGNTEQDLTSRLNMMDDAGVDRQVLTATPQMRRPF